MTCCIARRVAPVQFTADDVGRSLQFLEHDCKCGSCCRRVSLFSPRPNIENTDDWIVKVIARIKFGCRASCYGEEVEVDFKNGVILDLMGDYITVDYQVIEVVNDPPPLVLGAMSACCGAGAARGCATRTTAAITLTAAAQQVLIPVPPFAYAVTFASANLAGMLTADATFIQSGSGDSGDAYMANLTGDVLPDPWMLINGARTIIVNVPVVGEGTQTFEAVFLIGV